MKNKVMLSISKMIKASTVLVIFTSLLPLANVSAQKKQLFYSSGAPIEVGDSVMINRDSLRYETGERKLNWVYDQIHEVRQVSSKYHPDGVLMRGIYSWVKAGALSPMNEVKKAKPVPEPVYSSTDVTVNHGETYTWNGVVYTESGTYTQTLKAVNGGDSIVTLNLTVRPKTIYTTIKDSMEVEETYTWNGQTYTKAGSYTQKFLAKNGADSIVTLSLSTYRLPKPYQVNRFTIGARGGFATSLPRTSEGNSYDQFELLEGKVPVGFDVLLDLQYAHYWAKDENKPLFGILTGLSVGYMHDTYKVADYANTFYAESEGLIKYDVQAENMKSANHQIQMEVPVMFSMILPCGVFVNAGPKLILPVYASYKQTLHNPAITANLEDVGVSIGTNNPVMGLVQDEQCTIKGKHEQIFVTLALGAEVGYEFALKSGHSLGLGAYINGGVYNSYSPSNARGHLIGVNPPTADKQGEAIVNSLTQTMVDKMGYLDAGLKVTYNFNWIKK